MTFESRDAKEDAELRLPTVAAVSSPFGRGGVALLRVSGAEAIAAAEKVFVPHSGEKVRDLPSNRATFGAILSQGEKIDEGMLTVYRAPKSFTGEDVCELTCHGGILLTAKVLEALLRAGAEQAGPGEFSKRAFLNGKMSLVKAESVIDQIDAENEHQLRLASKNADGALSRRLEGVISALTELLADIYVSVDYPDEDLRELTPEETLDAMTSVTRRVRALADSYKTGRAVAQGVATAIVGRPNVGKSSLLNLLLGRERAIVSEIPGTTRDTVEEKATVGMITLHLIDTAGMRDSSDPVEKMGIERSRAAIERAELIFAVFDGGEEATDEDRALINDLRASGKQVLAILNKSDLPPRFERALLDGFPAVVLSAKDGKLPPELQKHLEELYRAGDPSALEEGLLTNARTYAQVSSALELLEETLSALRAGEEPQVAAICAEEALARLKQTDGAGVGEDIAASIFSRFCVGK